MNLEELSLRNLPFSVARIEKRPTGIRGNLESPPLGRTNTMEDLVCSLYPNRKKGGNNSLGQAEFLKEKTSCLVIETGHERRL